MKAQLSCFDKCDCACNIVNAVFDQIASTELALPIRLYEICRTNICWYLDRTLVEGDEFEKRVPNEDGLYILWHKDDYCPRHEKFHMRALYVGKGRIRKRVINHWKHKPTKEEMLIYVTYSPMKNRLAKYIEQLMLDVYNFPLNTSENPGTLKLCAHLDQSDVD